MDARTRVILGTAIFYAGWVKFLFAVEVVYYLDYAFRLAILLLVFRALAWREVLAPPSHGLKTVLFLLAGLYLAVVIQQAEHAARFFLEDLSVAGFPVLPAGPFRTFDLIVGLALVAVSEEVVFRYLYHDYWKTRALPVWWLYVVPSIAFGLLHLPRGVILAVSTAVFGALMMFLYRRTGSLWPPIVIHYVINFLIFSGLGCPWGMGGCVYG